MWKKIKVWRKQLLCVGTGMFLGAAAWILQERDPVIKEGNVLERPAADESYQEQELYVRGLVEKGGDIPFDLRIYPKHYTKEEAYNLYKEILDQIPEMIRGENISINEVQHDLELMTTPSTSRNPLATALPVSPDVATSTGTRSPPRPRK